nr:hypothetical protein DA06_22800 [Georgenia sp. SUBG003]
MSTTETSPSTMRVTMVGAHHRGLAAGVAAGRGWSPFGVAFLRFLDSGILLLLTDAPRRAHVSVPGGAPGHTSPGATLRAVPDHLP